MLQVRPQLDDAADAPPAAAPRAPDRAEAVGSPCDAASFIARFERAWASRSLSALGDLLHADVCLRQPLLSPRRGRAAALRSLANVLGLLPNLGIELEHWAGDSERIFIAFTLHARLGRAALRLPMVDRMSLVEGLIRERTVYFDPWPLVRAVLLQPWLLWRLLRAPSVHSEAR